MRHRTMSSRSGGTKDLTTCLGSWKRLLFRGEFLKGSQLDLNRIVAHHPKDGEIKFQRLQTKDDTDWIQEEANKVMTRSNGNTPYDLENLFAHGGCFGWLLRAPALRTSS